MFAESWQELLKSFFHMNERLESIKKLIIFFSILHKALFALLIYFEGIFPYFLCNE